jgi:hypothetical protein
MMLPDRATFDSRFKIHDIFPEIDSEIAKQGQKSLERTENVSQNDIKIQF